VGKVPALTAWSEAEPYLRNLKETILADIRPLLGMPGHAPFAITREVLSYIDHLGHLYSGKGSVRDRSQGYLEAILQRIDPNYGRRAGEIYQMYRCGPVHEFKPKTLENRRGQLLHWLCYVGKRTDTIPIGSCSVSVTHLQPVSTGSGCKEYALPVSTTCLIDDLLASIEEFIQSGPEDERVTAWNRAARELNAPQPSDFTV